TSLAGPLVAQSGTVRYDQSTRLNFNFPPNSPMASRAPRSMVKPMVLTFSPDGALFAAAPMEQGANNRAMMMEREVMVRAAPAGGGGREIASFTMMGAPGGFGGRGQDAVAGAYTDLSDGSYVEVREFLGRTFRIPTDRPS